MAKRLPRLLVACLILFAGLFGGVGLAVTSPAGIVQDETGTLTAAQLVQLDEGLSGAPYPFQVVLINTAFPGGRPADAEAQFRAYAHKVLNTQVPQDAVLILVALQDRLVDFRVYAEGPVNQAFLARTGRPFAEHTGAMLEAYRAPAQAGDIPGGILAAAGYVKGVLEAVPTPAPLPAPAPAPGPTIHYAQPEPTAPTGPPGNPWPAVVGIGILVAAGTWSWYFRRYRLARRDALDARDAFLGDLLKLMEQELPIAKKYAGAETLGCVTAAAAAADAALTAEQAGEAARLGAERLARFSRFASAAARMAEAAAAYGRADGAYRAAAEAWAPVAEALLNWDKVQAEAGRVLTAARGSLTAEQVRTGWPLTDLGTRLQREEAQLALARSCRDQDPVRALRLARETAAAGSVLVADLTALAGLAQELEGERRRRLEAAVLVAEARATLGLRFVEQSPDEPLAQAVASADTAAAALPPGAVEQVRAALAGARAASEEAVAIVARYREALQQHPLKSAALRAHLDELPGDERQAVAVLADLTTRYAAEDWADVRSLAEDLVQFQREAWDALAEVARMVDAAEQRYLGAVALLDAMLARREALREGLQALSARPAALDAVAVQAGRDVEALREALSAADGMVQESLLILPREVAERLRQAHQSLLAAEQQGALRPLPARRWAKIAAEGAAAGAAVRDAVAEVERLAGEARSRVARAKAEGFSALGYERYDHRGHAVALRGALGAAEVALDAGRYAEALSEADVVLECCRGLEMAYRAYVAEQEAEERRRREAEEASRRASESSSFSTASDTSSSAASSSSSSDSNPSSGGGGSW